MASYHFSVQVIKRSKGQSVLAAAAYRSGQRLSNAETGVTYDYQRRQGVVHSEIVAPRGSAPFLLDRQQLWGMVERMEGRRDAQLAREINLALPHELDAASRQIVLLNFVQEAFVSRGMVADVAIHAPVLEKGDHPHNHHAHILLTLRQATAQGLRQVKTREWNSDSLLHEWRALWAEHQNLTLARAGIAVRVDHRKLTEQKQSALVRGDRKAVAALDREPEIHMGRKARHTVKRERQPRKPQHSAEQLAHERVLRNQKIIQANYTRAQQKLDMWRRAYMARLNKPVRAIRTATVGHNQELNPRRRTAEPLVPMLPATITGMLARIGRGMSAWQLIAAARASRLGDVRARFMLRKSLLGTNAGRRRLRLRELDLPPVPQAFPAAYKPIPDLERHDGIGHLPRHQYKGAVIGQPHDLRGIDEIT